MHELPSHGNAPVSTHDQGINFDGLQPSQIDSKQPSMLNSTVDMPKLNTEALLPFGNLLEGLKKPSSTSQTEKPAEYVPTHNEHLQLERHTPTSIQASNNLRIPIQDQSKGILFSCSRAEQSIC